jgi:hypothetical protein
MIPDIKYYIEYGPAGFVGLPYIPVHDSEFMKGFGWYIYPNNRICFSIDQIEELNDWCNHHLKGRWKLSAANLFIVDKDDLVLFKLSK